MIVCCTRLSINFDDKPYCFPESTTSPAELTKRFGQTMKHAGIKEGMMWSLDNVPHTQTGHKCHVSKMSLLIQVSHDDPSC